MNRTIIILHILVSISKASPIGENPTAIIEDQNYKADDLVRRSPDEIDDVLVLVKKDDILITSDLTRLYNLLENKLGKTRSLREEPENEGNKNAELEHQSRAAAKSKSTENLSAEDNSDTAYKEEGTENRAAHSEEYEFKEKIDNSERLTNNENMAPTREESKKAEKIIIDIEPTTGTNEESKPDYTTGRTTIAQLKQIVTTEAEDFQSKGSTKEKRKSEVTKQLNELKSTTGTFRAENDALEYLENDSDIYGADSGRNRIVIKDQNTPIVKSESYQNDKVKINDRSVPKENSRNGYRNNKDENENKRAPKTDTGSFLNAKAKTINKQASKEDSKRGYRNDNVESNDKRTPKEEARSGYQNDEGESNGKSASNEDKNRKGYEMPINDESNSSWDLLDDIPISRRMLTHDNFNVEIKGKAAEKDVEPEEDRNAPEPKPIASRNVNSYGSTTAQYDRTVLNPELQSTVTIPYQSTIPNPQFQRINPQFQNTVPSQKLQTGWNPQLQNTVPNLQFHQTTLNPQTQSTVPNQLMGTVLNPQFPSRFLNSQVQTVPNVQFYSSVLNPQFESTVSIPHIHPSLLPVRRFIIPGIIKTSPAKPIDFRRLYSQEENNVQHQLIPYKTERNPDENVNYRNDEKSELPEPRELNIEDNSNAYPYSPPELGTEKTPQIAMVNPIFSKLVEASQHPKRFNPNFNGVK